MAFVQTGNLSYEWLHLIPGPKIVYGYTIVWTKNIYPCTCYGYNCENHNNCKNTQTPYLDFPSVSDN
jgi:hypothetical protein